MKSLTKTQLQNALAVIFTGIMVVCFISCGQQQQPSGEEQQTTAEKAKGKDGRIVVTANNGVPDDDKERLKEQELMLKIFHEKHPDIKLEISTWTFTPESFIAKMAAGTATDVIGVYATEGAKVIEKHLAADITDMVRNWKLYPYLNKELLEPFKHEGRIYGVPYGGLGGAYVMTLFYNKAMFKEAGIVDENGDPAPPQTWEEFVDISKQLTNRDKGITGFGILGDAEASGWHFLNWVWQSGGSFEEKIDGKWQATFDSPEAIRALQFIRDLRWKHAVLQKDVTANNDDLFELFVSERIAMALFTPEYLFYIVEKLGFPIEKIGITLLPAGPGGRVNQMGGSFLIINPTISEREQRAAFETITFNFDLEYIEEVCKLRREQDRLVGIPALPVFSPEYQSKIDAIIDEYRNVPSYFNVMAEAVKYVRAEPPFYAQSLYSQYLSPAVQKVLTDKSADPEKILEEGARKFQRRFLDKLEL